jgi:PAS domain S-box-containing protein
MHQPSDILARHLARVVDSSDDAIVSKGLDGTITSWNRGAERIFGYAAEEAIGRSIRLIIPADRQSEEDEVLRRIRAGEQVHHFGTIRQRKDGTLVHISLTVSPIRDDAGTVIGASKIARDVTEQVMLAERARKQAEVTRRLNEVGTVVASSLDRDAVVQAVTDIARELTGAAFGAFFYNVIEDESREAYMLYTLSGAPLEAFSKFPHPRATAIFAPTFHGEGPVRLDDVTADPRYGKNSPFQGMPEGHLPVRSYLAVPVVGAHAGQVLGGLFFGHPEPGRFTADHEQLVVGVATWASVALENARLYVDAQNASRMKDEFLAVLSHELRTPLSAIVGYARLLRGGILTGEKAMQGLEALDRSAASLTRIIEDVLDVSRIISGKFRLEVQDVDMPLVIHDAVAVVQPAADAKGVRIQTIIDPGVAPLAGDRDRLQQALWNLLSNAVKFTPKGGRVQVRLIRVNSHIEVVVADSGIGIRQDFLPQLFERFTQGYSGPMRKFGGLGLGLAIVRHIIELHGGTVDASSAGENQGATFTIRLPTMIVQSKATPVAREHPRARVLQPLTELTDLTDVRVMAVDDDNDALAVLRDVLESAGATVTTLSSPFDLLRQVGTARPDVLLIDLGMPEMDGYRLIERIRAAPDPLVRRIPAAALTAFARADDRTRALRSGFEMHLAKPMDPAELVASVSTLVRRARV